MDTQTHVQSVADIAQQLVPQLAESSARLDQEDGFVGQHYPLLKQAGLISAGVPVEFGGKGAEIPELCDMLQTLAHGCSSTALAFSMHTHQVAVPAWRWLHQQAEPVVPLLKRIAAEDLVLLSSGGSDFIPSSGVAVKVAGGYRVNARKVFTSGAHAGNILMTSARVEEENGSATVVHFGLPMNSDAVTIVDTWQVLGMRATGSNDVMIKDFFVDDKAVAFTRKAGEWHPVFHILAPIAFTLVYAVYLGVAEKAAKIAIELAKKRHANSHLLTLVGRMENALCGARLAHGHMLASVAKNAPGAENTNQAFIGRTLVGENCIKAVDLALEVAGGVGFYRQAGLEQCFRDIQAARYHPLQAGPQAEFAGASALGLPTENIY
jgi:alkylation response protein AidB-like acyl-CoA dehydrogenase